MGYINYDQNKKRIRESEKHQFTMAEQLDKTEFSAALIRFMQNNIQQQRSNASQPSEILLLQGNEQFEDTVGAENHEESIEESIANINELRQRSDDEENVSDHNTEFEETENYDVESFIDAIRDYVCIWNTSLRSHHELTKRKSAWENLARKFGKSGKFETLIERMITDQLFNSSTVNIVDSHKILLLVGQIHVYI